MPFLARLIRALPLLLLSPALVAISALAMAATDLAWAVFGRKRRLTEQQTTAPVSASVVIPNWNGRDLMEKYLPSVEAAMAGHPDNEIIVVDNASTDGSVDFLRGRFPRVRVVSLDRNRGFGGGSNAGFRAAKNRIVVLLNSDMRVAPDFLDPLLEGFTDDSVFAVSCQIFFSDPNKVREETGLTQGWWEDGCLRVRHRNDPQVTGLFPCLYGGGGSCAFDREKLLELGGFDALLAPFYLEDTDLGYMAWKRGWKVFYEPRSRVWHEHRGTIGKRFTDAQIQAVLKKNFILFCWKNIHEWRRLGAHLLFTWAGALLAVIFGDVQGRANFAGMWRAFLQLPGALRSRWRARSLASVSDTEAFRRPMGGYFRDRFETIHPDRQPLRVLFLSPYPICPPVHGGGVFMYQTLRELAKLCEMHVVELLDHASQIPANEELREFCASAEWLVRMESRTKTAGSILPHAVTEFANDDLEWLIHRQVYTRKIDVVQLEYTPLGQYACDYRQIPNIIFEHDVYFQSIARGLEHVRSPLDRVKARFEYLRAFHYELRMLDRCDRIQVCTRENREYLESYLPDLAPRFQEGLRAGIDTPRYQFRACGRQPYTMLFLGSFRHDPNRVALDWFVHNVLPLVAARRPESKLVVVGSEPPPVHAYADLPGTIELRGFVEDIREPLAECAVFVCPILSGSGVRVKLLEAFSAGIPTVSTRVGAEGLARKDADVCLLADDPTDFAEKILWLFDHPEEAAQLARRARSEVENNWDMAVITRRLAESYREALREKATSRPNAS